MAQKKKKQHYVPQFYLNAWSIPGSHQTHVYDKKTDSIRINNITDVAMENGFYDVIPEDVLSEEVINWFREQGLEPNQSETQGLEDGLAEVVEKDFSEELRTIIEKARTATPWSVNNCYFLSKEQKAELSAYLAIQYIRTKSIRTGFQEAADCINQFLADMGVPSPMNSENHISKTEAKNMHVQTLLDMDYLTKIAMTFSRLVWILGINRTSQKLYTSDNPIATYAHINDQIFSMSGISSKGIEVFFPLTPEIVLIMIDGSYHTRLLPYERRYLVLDNSDIIERYNGTIAMQSNRIILSSDGEFTLLKRMKERQPNVFNRPQTILRYGDKEYHPRINSNCYSE